MSLQPFLLSPQVSQVPSLFQNQHGVHDTTRTHIAITLFALYASSTPLSSKSLWDPQTLSPHVALPANVKDTSWYIDIGASHHLTTSEDNLSTSVPYNGTGHVMLGNGKTIPISHGGSFELHVSEKSLALHNLLHVPEWAMNLILVNMLCSYNDV